jgi:hypothetical protein
MAGLFGFASAKVPAGDDLRDPDSVPFRHVVGFAVGQGFETLGFSKNIESPNWLQRPDFRGFRHLCHLRGVHVMRAFPPGRQRVHLPLIHRQ